MNTIFDNFTGEVNLDIFRPNSEVPGASLRRQYLSLVGLLQYVDIINGDLTGTLPANITEQTVKGMIAHCIGDLKVREEMSKEPVPPVPPVPIVPPDDEIWYTSSDGNIIEPNPDTSFGVNIISNTYEDDKGIIKFDGPVTSIGDGAFQKCAGLTSITIPDSVTSIGEGAFASCTGLLSITIPDSVASIESGTFYNCLKLSSVSIPNNVTSIGSAAFFNCTGLSSITIPDSVASIGESAFQGCTGLASVVIGSGVTSIGYGVFNSCTVLASITCLNTTPPTLSVTMFYNIDENYIIYVPAESIDAYKESWSEYADHIQAIVEDNNEPEEEPGE